MLVTHNPETDVRYMLINKTVARSRKRFSVIAVTAGGQFE